MITLFIGLTILFAIFMWALGTVIGGLLPEGFFEEDEYENIPFSAYVNRKYYIRQFNKKK